VEVVVEDVPGIGFGGSDHELDRFVAFTEVTCISKCLAPVAPAKPLGFAKVDLLADIAGDERNQAVETVSITVAVAGITLHPAVSNLAIFKGFRLDAHGADRHPEMRTPDAMAALVRGYSHIFANRAAMTMKHRSLEAR
jgi:hypothetical protein